METRRAIRWVAGCAAAAVAIYATVSVLVTPDSRWTRLGQVKELDFVLRDLRKVEPVSTPTVWILGSSITREAFDAGEVERQLRAAGLPDRVHKVTFNRGAPVFSRAILHDLPVQPGDHVVTSVAEDNFVHGWLVETADFATYVEAVLDPGEILALADVPFARRLEWLLASAPPQDFHRYRTAFRRGLVREGTALVRGRKPPSPKRNVEFYPHSDTNRTLANGTTQDWSVDVELIRLETGTSNWDALLGMREDVRARGATLHLVMVPPHPAYYERYLDPMVFTSVHAGLRNEFPDLAVLRPRTNIAYMDYKHPNNRGRAGYTRELVDLLLESRGKPGLEPDVDPWLARPDEAPAAVTAVARTP
jgi:hypothetical protein